MERASEKKIESARRRFSEAQGKLSKGRGWRDGGPGWEKAYSDSYNTLAKAGEVPTLRGKYRDVVHRKYGG